MKREVMKRREGGDEEGGDEDSREGCFVMSLPQ